MPVKKEIDWSAVQADRDAGMAVSQICEKYDVSNPTVYTRTKGNGKSPRPVKVKPSVRPNGAPKHVSNGAGRVTIQLSSETIDAIWNSLSMERKGELLGKL